MITHCYHLVYSLSLGTSSFASEAHGHSSSSCFSGSSCPSYEYYLNHQLYCHLMTSPWISFLNTSPDNKSTDFQILHQFSTPSPMKKTSRKSFGLDSQGRGFRTEFTKTWRWIIRHGHQTHHVRPKGNETPPYRKTINVCRRGHRGTSPLMRLQLEAKFKVPSDSLQCLVAQHWSWEIPTV